MTHEQCFSILDNDCERFNFCPNCGADMRALACTNHQKTLPKHGTGGMTMYEELVKELREEAEWAKANEWETPIMLSDHLTQAADAIEELLDFAHFVASNVVVFDEEWDNNMLVFPEVASRKLNKLGIIKKDGAFWSYEPPKEE